MLDKIASMLGINPEEMAAGAERLANDIAQIKAGMQSMADALTVINANLMVLALGNERVPGQAALASQLQDCREQIAALAKLIPQTDRQVDDVLETGQSDKGHHENADSLDAFLRPDSVLAIDHGDGPLPPAADCA